MLFVVIMFLSYIFIYAVFFQKSVTLEDLKTLPLKNMRFILTTEVHVTTILLQFIAWN